MFFFMLVFNALVYLVNHYFLSAPGKKQSSARPWPRVQHFNYIQTRRVPLIAYLDTLHVQLFVDVDAACSAFYLQLADYSFRLFLSLSLSFSYPTGHTF